MMQTGKQILGKCPVCNRIMVVGSSVNEHHLKRKALKGKEKILIHKICHQKTHTIFTERELLKQHHTIEQLKAHAEMKKYIKWVQKYDPEFYDRNITTNRKKT